MKLQAIPLFVVFILAFCTSAVRGKVFTDEQAAKLVEFVDTLMLCRGVPGLTLAVVKDDESWTRGFGLADREREIYVNTSTLFAIGSVTKAFSTAILSLFINETGSYTWETPLVDILGTDFRLADAYLTLKTTLKDILVHRTGLETTNIPLFAGLPEGMDKAELAKRLRFLPVIAPFRDKFDYNNWMYGLAGHVSEVMGGATWEELLQTRLLHPLGMMDTEVLGQSVFVSADNFAKPYVMLGDEVVLSDLNIYSITPEEAAGAIASSADDMAKWLRLLLNKGKTPDGVVVLNDTRLQEMTSAYVSLPPSFRSRSDILKPVFPVSASTHGYGYAWMDGMYRGYPVTYHSGGLFAYITYLAYIPNLNFGVFISTNGPGNYNASRIIRQLFYHITDLVLGEDPWLNTTNACHFPELWLNSTKSGSSNATVPEKGEDFDHVTNFTGSYGHLLYGDVEVVLNGSRGLFARYGRIMGRLFRTEEENVTLMEVEGPMAFMFRAGDRLLHLKFQFSQPSEEDGKFQQVEVSGPELGFNEVLPFRRGVNFSDPVDDSNAGCWRGSSRALSTVAFFISVFMVYFGCT